MFCSLSSLTDKFLILSDDASTNIYGAGITDVTIKFDGEIKEAQIDPTIKDATIKSYKLIGDFFEKGEIRNAVTQIFDYVALANKYYDSKQPWIQVKEDINSFNDTTYTCIYMIANMANMIAPVLPHAKEKIKNMLNLSEYKWEEEEIKGDFKIQNLQVLYDRIDESKILNNTDESETELKKKEKSKND